MTLRTGGTVPAAEIDTVVLDLDGTLVDSVPTHVLAWQLGFRDVGIAMASYRLHGLIGMGGDRLIIQAAIEAVERAVGDELRVRHRTHLEELFWTIAPIQGATVLLESLHERGCTAVLASSSEAELTERLLGLIERNDLLTRVITGADAERSKPDGERIENALLSVDVERSVVVGDAVWDLKAAHDVGVRAVAVSTGGISADVLSQWGALAVFADVAELAAHLRETATIVPD